VKIQYRDAVQEWLLAILLGSERGRNKKVAIELNKEVGNEAILRGGLGYHQC